MLTDRNLLRLVGLGFELGFGIAISFWVFLELGQWAETQWGIAPWGIVAGVVLAFVTMIGWLYYRLKPYLT